jgi:hypothetical protein
LISRAFRGFGYTIVLNNAQFVQAATRLDTISDMQGSHPTLDQTLTWHRLTAPPILPRNVVDGLTDEQRATAVVAKILEAGLLTRLQLDLAFVIVAFEYMFSLCLPISMVSTEPLPVKCHHCGVAVVTRVEHVRGFAMW